MICLWLNLIEKKGKSTKLYNLVQKNLVMGNIESEKVLKKAAKKRLQPKRASGFN